MTRVVPIRREQALANPCAICTSAPPSPNSCIFCTYKIASHLHIPQLLKVPHFQYFASNLVLTPSICAHPPRRGGGEGTSWYGPGASLTDWTGGIPDTVEPVASACRTGTCHGKRAVLWNRSFDSSLSTNRAIEP